MVLDDFFFYIRRLPPSEKNAEAKQATDLRESQSHQN